MCFCPFLVLENKTMRGNVSFIVVLLLLLKNLLQKTTAYSAGHWFKEKKKKEILPMQHFVLFDMDEVSFTCRR